VYISYRVFIFAHQEEMLQQAEEAVTKLIDQYSALQGGTWQNLNAQSEGFNRSSVLFPAF
jgi:hypothetical protein